MVCETLIAFDQNVKPESLVSAIEEYFYDSISNGR